MTEPPLSAVWRAIAPGFANHLWQSTLVAAAAALLILALRKHGARARYWIWLAASLKFLVPFSLLVGLGSHLGGPHHFAPAANSVLYSAVEEFGQPFTRAAAGAASPQVSSPAIPTLQQLTPELALVWFCGFLFILFIWMARWRRIAAAMKASVPLSAGREVDTLRRVERVGGIRKPIPVLLSPASLEPGIFGITQPALLWPEGISRRLEDSQLEAVMAHEVWHVRRRDNLSAALHMLVEAFFWFHPLVWWLGSRLVEERERACDEEAVALGSDRQVYAESILKVCEFCLGSPLPCVSGVTGADLKERMVHIMTDRILPKLDFARKSLLTLAAIAVIALPLAFGLLHATPGHAQSQEAASPVIAPVFESATIKPDNSSSDGPPRARVMFSLMDGGFSARGVTLQKLILMAYHLQDTQLSGGPDWLNTQKFDIDAKFDSASTEALRKQFPDPPKFDDQSALRGLLVSRFKVVTHTETKSLPAYELLIAADGPKLQESKTPQRMFHLGKNEFTSSGTPISLLADELSRRLGQTVIDKTGLKSNYTFTLHWKPDANAEPDTARQFTAGTDQPPATTTDSDAPSILSAIQEQLGLKLEPRTEPVRILVIDHAEAPSEN